jgi:hypothetical protein
MNINRRTASLYRIEMTDEWHKPPVFSVKYTMEITPSLEKGTNEPIVGRAKH